MRIHLDTDFGGDPDDLCALAMLLGWTGAEITGITTTIDADGLRAGYVAHCLQLAGRQDIPLAAGAAVSLATGRVAHPFRDDPRYWSPDLAPRPSPPAGAHDLLLHSIARGAVIAAIGPLTTLARLEMAHPGALRRARTESIARSQAPVIWGRLGRVRVDEEDILTSARELHGPERRDQIKYAVPERSGGISVIPKQAA